MRSSGRRSGGTYERRRDEEYGRDEESTRPGRGQDADSLIADMAKGFVEAQAKITGAPAGGSDREMLALLAKISRQLDELRSAPAGGQQSPGQERGDNPAQESAEQEKSGQQDDLSAIFSRLLAANKSAAGPKQQSGGAQQSAGMQNSAGQQGGGSRQQSGGGSQSSGQANSQGTGGGHSVTAQTAAQALAQAQYELANELEASLTKLKQVISESEKLADRISNLLGQENSSRQT